MICNFLVIRLRSFCGNSVNEGNLHFARTISGDVTVTLTSMTLSGGTKFERSLLGGFATIITLFTFEFVLSGGGLGAKLILLRKRKSSRHTRF